MIVLTEIGSFIMDVNSYFDSVYAPKALGLENPFWANHKAWAAANPTIKNPDGSRTIQINPYDKPYDKEYIREYNLKKNDYVALRIFQKYGYTEYMKYAYNHEVNLTVLPCEGADGQCNMECEKFGTC